VGIKRENVIVIAALGAHRAMTLPDFRKKLGEDVVSSLVVYNHYAYDNLVQVGTTRVGPVKVNRFFAEAEVKLGVGCVCPHGYTGFSGGAKIVLPGVAGIDTIEANHRPHAMSEGDKSAGVGAVENKTRQDMEECARKVGLDLIVNVVVNSSRGIAGVFVGNPVKAHRAAVALARKVYATKLPEEPVDVAILNSYPKDTELTQSIHALNVFGRFGRAKFLKEGGTFVIVAACSEGRGFHLLADRGMRLYMPFHKSPGYKNLLERYNAIIFSANINIHDICELYPEKTFLARTWPEVVARLQSVHNNPSVAVFPCSAIQLPDAS